MKYFLLILNLIFSYNLLAYSDAYSNLPRNLNEKIKNDIWGNNPKLEVINYYEDEKTLRKIAVKAKENNYIIDILKEDDFFKLKLIYNEETNKFTKLAFLAKKLNRITDYVKNKCTNSNWIYDNERNVEKSSDLLSLIYSTVDESYLISYYNYAKENCFKDVSFNDEILIYFSFSKIKENIIKKEDMKEYSLI